MKKIFIYTLFVFLMLYATILNATIRYVDAAKADNTGAGTTWATAKKDLQDAINAASSGDQIWVKAGTYKPTPVFSGGGANDRTFYMKDGVAIYGGFVGTETTLAQRNFTTNITILSGDFNNDDGIDQINDNAYHVVVSVSDGASTILDGFTIKGGNANGNASIFVEGSNVYPGAGGGVYNFNSSLTIANCNITQNKTVSNGGAIYNYSSSSTIINCSFSQNYSSFYGAAIYNSNSSGLTIINCSFSQNTTPEYGGAVYNTASSPTITNCSFLLNSVTKRGGAVYNTASSPTITNCNFAQNDASSGGAVCNESSSNPKITNCSFMQNTGGLNPGAVYNVSSSPTITNCILWGNNIQIANSSSTPTVTYSIVQGGYSGTGNLSVNPLFVNANDPDGADNIFGTTDDGLQLQCISPAINSGTTTGAPASDILGAARVGNTDMGAYENTSLNMASPNTMSVTQIVNSGINIMGSCSGIICVITTNGASPISGNTTAKVWVESSQPSLFVKRHYEITPATNALTATASITLYFTQAEFDDFNAVNTVKLPTDPADVAGIANLKIEKRSGTSSDGTGLPATYTNGSSTIDPADANIVWNGSLKRWEVTFDVTGFSSFFAKTNGALPVTFGNISAIAKNGILDINFTTLLEKNCDHFDIQLSKDANNWQTIGTVATQNVDGNSNTQTIYNFNKNLQEVPVILGLGVLALMLLFVKNRSKVRITIIAVLGFVLVSLSCHKSENISATKDTKLFIRVIQVDKDGAKQISKVQQVLFK